MKYEATQYEAEILSALYKSLDYMQCYDNDLGAKVVNAQICEIEEAIKARGEA